jgi:hypothetical protein
VEHELLGGESKKCAGASIARSGGAENDRHQRRERSRIGRGSPRNQILDVLALGGGENGEEKSGRRLTPVARRGDDAEGATSDPTAAPFVAERRPPPSAPHNFAGWAAAIRDRTGTNDEKNSRAIVERIVHRNQAIRVDHHHLGELFCIERRVEGLALFVSAGASDTAVENSWKHRAGLGDFGKCSRHEIGDDFRGTSRLAGHNRRLGSVKSR